TIVMVSLLRKLIRDDNDRLFFAGITVIAANAGGAWSPIGDVTTTMLWIGRQITPLNIIAELFLPSLVCIVVPLLFSSLYLKGNIPKQDSIADGKSKMLSATHQSVVFFSGVTILILVPVFEKITSLPPFMGILTGLGILWIITEIMHGKKDTEDKHRLSVTHALRKIDMPCILFFLGILVSVAALESTHILASLADQLADKIGNLNIIVLSFGLVSAVIDNVPLVAAAQGMYPLQQYPTDHYFWEFLAYCTGTGGSVLIIGSAAGVAAMGMEKINFFWYLRKIAWLALAGYFAGALVYILEENFF
ncbi:MAG: sodium:proton antiporter NhaD, partial [Bacteroidia bacterium]